MSVDPEDPRLTAYALGELEGPDRAEIETLVERDAEARRFVEQTRELARILAEQLRDESAETGLSDAQCQAIARRAGRKQAARVVLPEWCLGGRWLGRALAAAAMLALGVGTYSIWRVKYGPPGPPDGDRAVATEALAPPTALVLESQPAAPPALEPVAPAPSASSNNAVPLPGAVDGLLARSEPGPLAAPDTSQADAPLVAVGSEEAEAVRHVEAGARGLGASGADRSDHVALGYGAGGITPASPAAPLPAEGAGPMRGAAVGREISATAKTSLGSRGAAETAQRRAGGRPDARRFRAAPSAAGSGGAAVDPRSMAVTSHDLPPLKRESNPDPARVEVQAADGPERNPASPVRARDAEPATPLSENDFVPVRSDQTRVTFSPGVESTSYANARRMLSRGVWPPPGTVRIEELINAFPYAYPEPSGNAPVLYLVRADRSTLELTALAASRWSEGALDSVSGPQAVQSRLPDRRLGLDRAAAPLAPAASGRAAVAGRSTGQARHDQRAHPRGRGAAGPATDQRPQQGGDRRGDRPDSGRAIDPWRAGHPARLSGRR